MLAAHIADVGGVPIYLHHGGAIIAIIFVVAVMLAPHRSSK